MREPGHPAAAEAGRGRVREFETFTFEIRGPVAVFTFRGRALFNAAGLYDMEPIADSFRECTESPEVKVILVQRSPERKDAGEHAEFVRHVARSSNRLELHRMLNFYSRFILEVYGQRRFVVSVDSGRVVAQFFNMSLACDHRIVSDDTIIQKEYFRNGVVPKGGATFFLSRLLGRSRAYELLLSERDLTAAEALELGLVDEVVPRADLERAAMQRATELAAIPEGTLVGTKLLMNHDRAELEKYLAFENEVIAKVYGRLG